MNSILVKYPTILKWLYPKRLSRIKSKKTLYLTFDDGPIPGVTPWVLAELKQYRAKATFFCIGENIKKHPEVFQQILAEEHRIGNHTYNHLNGWKTSKKHFIENTLLAEKMIKKFTIPHSKKQAETRNPQPAILNPKPLFRPPFGKIKNSQAKDLVKKNYRIVMWDVVSWDFSSKISKEECFKNVINNTKEGSIIVFHDSLNAEKKLKYTLPKVLDYYSKKGFEFKALA